MRRAPRCADTAIDKEWKDGIARPCPLRNEIAHGIKLPPEVIAYMTEQRDKDRAAARYRAPRFEVELAVLASQENTGGEG
jgi:hypothetical protein